MKHTMVLVLLLLCCPAGGFAEDILIVSDEWPQMEVFAAFVQAEAGYGIVKAEQDKIPDDLSRFHGVIQFVHGMLEDDSARKLMDYANQGGRLLVIHHGISSKKKQTKGWYAFLGMELDRNKDAEHYYEWIHGIRLTFANLHPRHYITTHKVKYPGAIKYQSSDQPSVPVKAPALVFEDTEVFLNHQFTDGREKTVLFGFRYEDAGSGRVYMQDRAGWYKPAGKGWVFYFQPGHSVSDFENENYCQILLNCLTWKRGAE